MANAAAARDARLKKAGQMIATKQSVKRVRPTKTPNAEKEVEIALKIVALGVGGSLSGIPIISGGRGGKNDTLLASAMADRGIKSVDARIFQEAQNILVSAKAGSLNQSTGPSLKSTISNSLLFMTPIIPALGTAAAATAAVTGGLSAYANDGDLLDAIKAAAISYGATTAGSAVGQALDSAVPGSFLGDVAGGVNAVGNFLDPIIPDFIKAPGDIFGQAKTLVDSGANANDVIGALVEANPDVPIETLIAATNEAAGIGIPGNGVLGSSGNFSQFTGAVSGALPGALNTSIATGGPGAADQAFEAAKELVASGKNANEVVADLVDQGVEVKTAIDAANEAAGVGIPGNGIPGDPGNVSQFTGLPAGAGTGAVNTAAATGGNQVSETSDLFDTVSDLASLIGDLTGVVGTITGAKAASDAADAAADATDSQTDIANRLAQISEEQWAIWKEDYRPFSKASAATQLALLPDYEEAQRTSLQAITDDREYYLNEIRPIEQQMAEEAQPQYDYVTSLAAADADQAQQRAIDITERNLQRAGIDPNSGRWQAEINQNFAGTRAGMINAARERERTTSFDKKALVTGRGAVNRNGNATAPGVNQAISPSQATTGFSNAASQFGNVANSQYGQEQVYAGGAGDSAGAVTYSNSSTGGVLGAVNQGLGAIQTVGNIYDAGKSVYNAGKSIYDGVSGFFGFEDGGMIPEISTMNPAQRGAISVPGYPVGPTDTVPGMIVGANGETANAMLAPGEVVIPEEIVRAKGTDFFEKLLNPKTASRAI